MKAREIWWTQSRKLCHKWICPATWVFGKKCDTSSLFQAPANRAKECAANWDITRLLPTLQRAWSHLHPTAYFSGLVTTLTYLMLLSWVYNASPSTTSFSLVLIAGNTERFSYWLKWWLYWKFICRRTSLSVINILHEIFSKSIWLSSFLFNSVCFRDKIGGKIYPQMTKKIPEQIPVALSANLKFALFLHSFQDLSLVLTTNEPERWSCQRLFSSFLKILTSQAPYLQKSEANLDKFLHGTLGFLYK